MAGLGLESGSPAPVYLFFFFFFWPRHAHGILVPQPEIEPRPPAVEAQRPNHWTTREFPVCVLITARPLLRLLKGVVSSVRAEPPAGPSSHKLSDSA